MPLQAADSTTSSHGFDEFAIWNFQSRRNICKKIKQEQQQQQQRQQPSVTSLNHVNVQVIQQQQQHVPSPPIDRVKSLSPPAVRRLKETIDAAAVNSNTSSTSNVASGVDSKPTHAIVTMPLRPVGPPPSPKIGKVLPQVITPSPPTRTVTVANNIAHSVAGDDDQKARAVLQRASTSSELDTVSPRKPKPLPSLPKPPSSTVAPIPSAASSSAAAAPSTEKNYSSLALIDSFLTDYVDKNLVNSVLHYGSLPAEVLEDDDDAASDSARDQRAIVYDSLPVPPQQRESRESPEVLVEWNESERPAMETDMELCGESGVFEPITTDDDTRAILDQLIEDEEKEKEKENNRKSQ
jgi:hypothetical protein